MRDQQDASNESEPTPSAGFGKVILLGEHAVVFGHPALAGSLGLAVSACATPSPESFSTLEVAAWDLRIRSDGDELPNQALAALVTAGPADHQHYSIIATSDLPARAGLGSSAALSVAIVRSLAAARGEALHLAEVERRAQAGERCFHDNPSGVDVAVAARRGFGLFRRSVGLRRVLATPLTLVVGFTGEPRQTADMVAIVAAKRRAHQAATDRCLDRLGQLAERGATALASGDLTAIGAMFSEAQSHLATLGVSSVGIDRMVGLAKDCGALGAKLTGAGGGGAVIALAPGRESELRATWNDRGFDAVVTTVGAGGQGQPAPADDDA